MIAYRFAAYSYAVLAYNSSFLSGYFLAALALFPVLQIIAYRIGRRLSGTLSQEDEEWATEGAFIFELVFAVIGTIHNMVDPLLKIQPRMEGNSLNVYSALNVYTGIIIFTIVSTISVAANIFCYEYFLWLAPWNLLASLTVLLVQTVALSVVVYVAHGVGGFKDNSSLKRGIAMHFLFNLMIMLLSIAPVIPTNIWKYSRITFCFSVGAFMLLCVFVYFSFNWCSKRKNKGN